MQSFLSVAVLINPPSDVLSFAILADKVQNVTFARIGGLEAASLDVWEVAVSVRDADVFYAARRVPCLKGQITLAFPLDVWRAILRGKWATEGAEANIIYQHSSLSSDNAPQRTVYYSVSLDFGEGGYAYVEQSMAGGVFYLAIECAPVKATLLVEEDLWRQRKRVMNAVFLASLQKFHADVLGGMGKWINETVEISLHEGLLQALSPQWELML